MWAFMTRGCECTSEENCDELVYFELCVSGLDLAVLPLQIQHALRVVDAPAPAYLMQLSAQPDQRNPSKCQSKCLRFHQKKQYTFHLRPSLTFVNHQHARSTEEVVAQSENPLKDLAQIQAVAALSLNCKDGDGDPAADPAECHGGAGIYERPIRLAEEHQG
jgi:hypothetical protein